MPVGVNDILEVGIVSSLYAQTVMTILHYRVIAGPTQTVPITSQEDCLDLLTTGGAKDILTPYFACCSVDLTFSYMSAQYIWPTRFRKSFVTPSITGAISGAAKQANTAGTITKLSDLAGRKNRGAVHMPGISSSDIASGKIQGTTLIRLAAFTGHLLAELDEAGGGTGVWYPIIYHRGSPAGSGPVITSAVVQTNVRTMRRRTLGLGI